MLRKTAKYLLSITSLLMCVAATAHEAEPVRIALIIPMSGPFASVGELYQKNTQFIIDDINARGGVLGGRPLEVIVYDNKMSPQESLLALRRIIDERIPFVISTAGSHIMIPLADTIERHNLRNPDNRLLFLAEPGDPGFLPERCSFWSFGFHPSPESKMLGLTNYIATRTDIKRVYLINQDYEFGQKIRKYAREMLSRQRPDIEIVGDDLHPLGKVKDFNPYVAKIRAAGADAVVTANWGPDLALLVRPAADSGLAASFFTYYGMGLGTPTAMGPAAIGKVKVIWRWHPNLPFADERSAADAYKKRFGLDYYSMPLHNLFAMLVAALDKAGSTDAIKVAYALEDMRVTNSMGEAWMRADDHQLFEPLYIINITRLDGKNIKYQLEETELGTETAARIEAQEMMLPVSCTMKRPPRP